MDDKFSLSALLEIPFISRVRRNHAVEHATMQVLSERHPSLRLVGRSSLWGFYIYGDVSTDSVLEAAQEGVRRLKAGHRQMAVHPHCGSNFVVAGTLAGLGAFVTLGGPPARRADNDRSWFLERLSRLPLACAVATLAIILARPLGRAFQARVTTQADIGDLHVVGVVREERVGMPVHFVRTEG